jgi:hypothetical protein
MAEHGYTHHLLAASMKEAAELLTRLNIDGVVLSSNGLWACLLLPQLDDKAAAAARFNNLVEAHQHGVLCFDTGALGHRVRFGKGPLRCPLNADTLDEWVGLGLLDEADLPEIRQHLPDGVSWPDVLALPHGAMERDILLAQRFLWKPAAIPVGVDWLSEEEEEEGTNKPRNVKQLFALLVETGVVALVEGADAPDMATHFALKSQSSDASALLEWLISHPQVDEVYITDAAFEMAVASLG